MIKRSDAPSMMADPEYAAEHQRLTELKAQLNEIERAYSDAQTRTTPNESSSLHAAAMALVAGVGGGVAVAEEPAVDLSELTHRLRVTREAVEIQTRLLRTAESVVSKRVIESIRPAYTARLREIAEKAVELGRLCDAEREFRDTLQAAGYSAGMLQPCVLTGGMSIEDKYSRLNHFLNEVERDRGVKVK